jgi:hypothetical protein
MKPRLFITLLLVTVAFYGTSNAQQHRRPAATGGRPRSAAASRSPEIGQTGVIIDDTLSVLRVNPSLFSEAVQRMHCGRKVQIQGVAEADGVKFYKVIAPPNNVGWVQADAVFGKFRPSDEARLAKVVQALEGFDQIEAAIQFFDLYPKSQFRPTILLLFGDVLEEVGAKLSKDAGRRLKHSEMAASAAPLHSYYLNYVSLDRYRKLGIVFLFDSATRQFHYDGASWKEIVAKFPAATEAAEAKNRLDALKVKMELTAAK